MSRAPYQVLIIPFKKEKEKIKYCILKRQDYGWWQWIAGGGERGETSIISAKRESLEELGIEESSNYITLESMASIPAKHFKFVWGKDVLVVPEYSFAVEITQDIKLSHEHTEYKWVEYEEAEKLLQFDSNKIVLWELHLRLTGEVK